MMLRVIDTIQHRQSWTHRYPDLAAKGEGLLVVLESEGAKPDASLVGKAVSVHRPDGSTITLVVDRVERGAGERPRTLLTRPDQLGHSTRLDDRSIVVPASPPNPPLNA